MNGKGFSCGLCAAVALVCASLAFAELPIGTGIAFAAGSLGVWELRRETAGGRMRPASDTARRDVSPLLGGLRLGDVSPLPAVFPVPPHWAGKFGIIYPNRHA